MNVGFFFNGKLYPPKAGGNVHAYQIVKQLTRLGHQVSTIFYDTEDPLLKVYHRRDFMRFIRDLDVLYVRAHGKFDKEIYTLFKLLRGRNLPVVWEINAPLEEGILLGKSSKDLSVANFKRRCLAKLVSGAVCVSEELKTYAMNDLGIKNIKMIPNGSDTELFSPQKRDPNIYKGYEKYLKVVWAGTAHFGWHGVDSIFKIADEVYKEAKDVVFILIGAVRDIRLPEGGYKNVIILDQKNYLDLPPYLASADLGLCFYHDEEFGVKFYRSPLKLFDYMASGLPVIASKIGQIEQVIEHQKNGLLVEKNSNEDIVGHILKLKDDFKARSEMGMEARKTVEEYYNWERVGKETEGFFRTLVK